MGWEVKIIDSIDIIEVRYYGHITRLELEQAVKKRIELQYETGSKLVLADASKVENGPSTIDLFDLPDEIYMEHNASRQSIIALVLPKSDKPRELGQFYKLASQNRGWIVEEFDDRESAIDWLDKSAK